MAEMEESERTREMEEPEESREVEEMEETVKPEKVEEKVELEWDEVVNMEGDDATQFLKRGKECPICLLDFPWEHDSQFRHHMLDEFRPYQRRSICPQCGKWCGGPDKMQDHFLMCHAGLKKFVCDAINCIPSFWTIEDLMSKKLYANEILALFLTKKTASNIIIPFISSLIPERASLKILFRITTAFPVADQF